MSTEYSTDAELYAGRYEDGSMSKARMNVRGGGRFHSNILSQVIVWGPTQNSVGVMSDKENMKGGVKLGNQGKLNA